jgi:hypothetical protein
LPVGELACTLWQKPGVSTGLLDILWFNVLLMSLDAGSCTLATHDRQVRRVAVCAAGEIDFFAFSGVLA